MNRHLRLLEFALASLWRRKYKNLSIGLVYVVMVFMVSSVVLFSESFKKEAMLLLKDCPELIVQRITAGRHALVPRAYIKTIKSMPGVGKVVPRYWGYYYDPLTEANYTVMGMGGVEPERIKDLQGRLPQKSDEVAVGYGVAYFRFLEEGSELLLQTERGGTKRFRVVGIFRVSSQLLTNDLIVMTDDAVQELFNIPQGFATDLYVQVFNPQEVPTIAKKIKSALPDSRPITRQEVRSTYENVFSWRSGLLLSVFLGALLGFFILAWDRATALGAEEKREIGILKAIGWDIRDVIEAKLLEAGVLSLVAYLTGMGLSVVHLYFTDAALFGPVLKGWSVLFPPFKLLPSVGFYECSVVFFLTVLPYMFAVVVPTWRASIIPPDEVMR